MMSAKPVPVSKRERRAKFLMAVLGLGSPAASGASSMYDQAAGTCRLPAKG